MRRRVEKRIPQVAQRAIPMPEADRVELLVALFNAAAATRVSVSVHETNEPQAAHALRLWCEKNLVGIETRILEHEWRRRFRTLKAIAPGGAELIVFCKTIDKEISP